MPDEPDATFGTGGLDEAPRSSFSRAARSLVGLAVVVVAAGAIAVAAAALPSGTEPSSLVARGAVGLTIGLALIFVVRRMLRALVAPPPPPPATVDARPADVIYECAQCGTRVRLEVAATAKPPRHCGEEMEAKIG